MVMIEENHECTKHETLRELLELSLNYVRKHKSAQTGYLHYHAGANDQEPHLSIPLMENFLCALALLRSRTVENIQEGKAMLEGLLHFQNKNSGEISCGNFPIYLHEYPICKDRFTGVHIAVAIFWIIKLFHQVLGQELNARLEESLKMVLQHALHAHAEKPAPYPVALKLACVAAAAGQHLQAPDLQTQGMALLEHTRAHPDQTAWFCPAILGSMLASLKLLYRHLESSPWQDLWQHLSLTWHRQLKSYSGPALREWQQGFDPQVTLYDLFLGYFSGGLSQRSRKESPVHLEAVLIPPCDDKLPEITYPHLVQGELDEAHWIQYQTSNYAYSLVEQGKVVLNPIYEKGFHPLKVMWGDEKHVHTLVCQSANSKQITYHAARGEIELCFHLEGAVDVEERENCRDAAFYLDAHDGMTFLIDGEKSSTFRLGQVVSMTSGPLLMTLQFHLEQGQGQYIGHRMLGNRSSQISNKGVHRYDAYDWFVFMRTLGREEKALLKATLKIVEQQ